jgi:uncharacterized membrane protein YhdT
MRYCYAYVITKPTHSYILPFYHGPTFPLHPSKKPKHVFPLSLNLAVAGSCAAITTTARQWLICRLRFRCLHLHLIPILLTGSATLLSSSPRMINLACFVTNILCNRIIYCMVSFIFFEGVVFV